MKSLRIADSKDRTVLLRMNDTCKYERHVHTQVSVWIHSCQKKKRRPIPEKKEKPTPTMTEQAWNTLYSLADITDNYYCNKM